MATDYAQDNRYWYCVFYYLCIWPAVASWPGRGLFVANTFCSTANALQCRRFASQAAKWEACRLVNKLAQSANSPCFTLSCFAPTYKVPILPVTFNPLPLCMVPPRVFYPYPPRADVIVMERAKRVWAHVDLPDAKCSLLRCSKPEMGAGITRMILSISTIDAT